MNYVGEYELRRLREMFKTGTRVELVSMDDPYSKLVPGDTGVVHNVDDIGTVHVDWDSGVRLGAVLNIDVIKII